MHFSSVLPFPRHFKLQHSFVLNRGSYIHTSILTLPRRLFGSIPMLPSTLPLTTRTTTTTTLPRSVPSFSSSFLSSTPSNWIKLVEVGPRDGLQNERQRPFLSLLEKQTLIQALCSAGCKHIELGAFVSPTKVPAMADTLLLLQSLPKSLTSQCHGSVLIPNLKGLHQLLQGMNLTLHTNPSCVKEIAVFAAASEQFSLNNIGCSIQESYERFQPVIQLAKEHQLLVRGYVSCVVGCPYEGKVEPKKVAEVAKTLFDMGCYEISLGDTIGVGTPSSIQTMLTEVFKLIPLQHLALHCHDTYGQALANLLTGLHMGLRIFDSSIAGLGGCPYAPGASGNVATEDVVYMLHGMGYETGLQLNELVKTGHWISERLNKPSYASKTGYALFKKMQQLSGGQEKEHANMKEEMKLTKLNKEIKAKL